MSQGCECFVDVAGFGEFVTRHTQGQTAMEFRQPLAIYPVENYTEEQKEAEPERENSIHARMTRIKASYLEGHMRRSVEAVLIGYQHRHPHVFVLSISSTYVKLPGGRLRKDEDEVQGLRRKLSNKLGLGDGQESDYQVVALLSTWWRPNFDQYLYPYLPPHVTEPKECRKIFLVQLPERCTFRIPKNMSLVKVPLMDLYENNTRFGSQLSSIPTSLSRFRIRMEGEDINPDEQA